MQSEIKKVPFKPGLALQVEVISIADTILTHEKSITVPHRAQFYNIFWIQKGSAQYVLDFSSIHLKENSFLFVNKDRVKVLDSQHPHDGKILLFTDDFFARNEEDAQYLNSTILFNDLLEVTVIDVVHLPALQTIFKEIEQELALANDSFHSPIVHHLLSSLLLMAERERRKHGFKEIKKGADLDYTILFKTLLEVHYKTLKAVSGYASLINIPEKRLNKATEKTAGKSPKDMIDERVMLEAKRLLANTSLNTKEIGYELGFDDPAYFTRFFRKHAGKTPVVFREDYMQQ